MHCRSHASRQMGHGCQGSGQPPPVRAAGSGRQALPPAATLPRGRQRQQSTGCTRRCTWRVPQAGSCRRCPHGRQTAAYRVKGQACVPAWELLTHHTSRELCWSASASHARVDCRCCLHAPTSRTWMVSRRPGSVAPGGCQGGRRTAQRCSALAGGRSPPSQWWATAGPSVLLSVTGPVFVQVGPCGPPPPSPSAQWWAGCTSWQRRAVVRPAGRVGGGSTASLKASQGHDSHTMRAARRLC